MLTNLKSDVMEMKTNNEMINYKFKIMKAVNLKPENPCDPNLLWSTIVIFNGNGLIYKQIKHWLCLACTIKSLNKEVDEQPLAGALLVGANQNPKFLTSKEVSKWTFLNESLGIFQ